MHALGDRPRHECEQAKKGELDEIHKRQNRRACRARLHHVREQLDGNMRVAPRHHRAADEHDPHQAITGDLLGPGQAVIEHIAREKLQEDDEGKRPEDDEGNPVFRVMLDLHLGIFDLNETLLAVRRRLLAHDPPRSRPWSMARRAKRGAITCRYRYFKACSASYSAFDQPAPALASLCSGTAALRNASRSTSTTVLPSLRSWSAICCSE